MENIFFQLALALSLASVFGYFVLKLKLPLVIAYLLAGVAISIASLVDPHHSVVFEILPEIGIAFVLFLIGMELDLREIKALGLPIVVAALGQIIITTLAGYAVAGFLGFSGTESIFLGLGLAFSSTVVVIKMLLENRDLSSLYGKLSIGILLIEDLVAIGVLMFISVSSSALNVGLTESFPIIKLLLSAVGLFILTFVLSRYVLERIFDRVAKSVELLFLTAITWCFLFTSLAVFAGFSVVIGAFLAGVALASSPYHLQIQGKVKPLRDFFLTLFFVYLGMQANINDIVSYIPTVLIFTVFAILIKPILYMLLLGVFGFKKHTLFQTGLNLSQVSEFSLVVLLVGVQSGTASTQSLSVMAAVAVLSIILSSTMISYSKRLFKVLSPFMSFFEHGNSTHELEVKMEGELNDHIVVIGAHRVGGPIVDYLRKAGIPVLVLDFNPHIIQKMRDEGVNVLYGDIGDPEIIESLQLERAKLVISTATDIHDTELLLEECDRLKFKGRIVVRAIEAEQVPLLKKMGADYVILPEQVSGDFLVSQLKAHWPEVKFNAAG